MTATNYHLCAIAAQDDATRTAFAEMDLLLAKALGCGDAERKAIEPIADDEPESRREFLESWNEVARDTNAVRDREAVAEFRQARTLIARHFMQAVLSNPNAKATIAEMAEWAVLGADVLLDKLASQRAVRMTPPA